MAELKNKPTDQSVDSFLETIPDAQRRQDCETMVQLMQEATRTEPQMWGSNIVGLGNYHYKYASGLEGEWFLVGFSPRKNNLTLYLGSCVQTGEPLLKKLGKHKTGKACLYINRVEDVDLAILRELIRQSVERMTHANAPAE